MDLVAVKKKLQEIWKIVGLYKNEDIYYMNKSVLFWKMISDRILVTKQSIREKHNKVWIIINLAYNADKSHKLELWFIKTAIIPYYFSKSSINIKNFRMVWRSNKNI